MHNNLRALHGALPLVWDNTLAAKAQAHADTCEWGHTPGRQVYPNGESIVRKQQWCMQRAGLLVLAGWGHGPNESRCRSPHAACAVLKPERAGDVPFQRHGRMQLGHLCAVFGSDGEEAGGGG